MQKSHLLPYCSFDHPSTLLKMPKKQKPLVFWDKSWFYPILLEYTSNDTLFDLIMLFHFVDKTFLSDLNHRFLDDAMQELFYKRLAALLKYQNRYYSFDPMEMKYVLDIVGHLETSTCNAPKTQLPLDSDMDEEMEKALDRNFFSR